MQDMRQCLQLSGIWILLMFTGLLVACNGQNNLAKQLTCNTTAQIAEQNSIVTITCSEPSFLVNCDEKSVSVIGHVLTCQSSTGQLYSIKNLSLSPTTDASQENISNVNPVVAAGVVRADNQSKVIMAFYDALTRGDGTTAVQFIVPEKQETGNYTSNGMSTYWSEVDIPLAITGEMPFDGTDWAVSYTYKPKGGMMCSDTAKVSLEMQNGTWFISKIVPEKGC
ncbi:MAG TPA: hypothetical protein VHA78_03245 [Candidatus Peribacteraceae bacterium]|nr:hypothetical protein [Candidatus Peribacteraceae bacterium]